MKVVIQCAAKKLPAAASLLTSDGKTVFFVARPDKAPPSETHTCARPDDLSDDGQTWRDRLLVYNREAKANPLNLLPAYRLYANDSYRKLVDRFGTERVFILSAGWGLISAVFLTPAYDITFSAMAELYKRRRKNEIYRDFCMLPDDGEEILFLGGKDYLPLFCNLTRGLNGMKRVFYNAATCPVLPKGFKAVKYETTTRTNWHYECASDLIEARNWI
jgi:hypothetical protein